MRVLLTQHYLSSLPERQLEIDTCLLRNLSSPFFSRVILFCENNCSSRFSCYPQVTTVLIEGRMTYGHAFDWAQEHLAAGDIIVLSNSDIVFDDSLQLADTAVLNPTATCLALSRYDLTVTQQPQDAILFNRLDSQDTWIISLPLSLPPEQREIVRSIPLGVASCDNRVAYELEAGGYRVLNPALDIKSYHLHLTGYRTYIGENRLRGNYKLLVPSKLRD